MNFARLFDTNITTISFGICYSSSMSCCISISIVIVSKTAQLQAHTRVTHPRACSPNQ